MSEMGRIIPEGWFPSKESQRVVGRVIEIEKVHGARSREEKRVVTIIVPAMASKVAGEADFSTQELKKHNEHEFKALCDRFPGAWEAYEKSKAQSPKASDELPPLNGMSIDKVEFISREKVAWLKMQGFTTVEQLAAIDDSQIQRLGPGARTWKKKAVTLLKDSAAS